MEGAFVGYATVIAGDSFCVKGEIKELFNDAQFGYSQKLRFIKPPEWSDHALAAKFADIGHKVAVVFRMTRGARRLDASEAARSGTCQMGQRPRLPTSAAIMRVRATGERGGGLEEEGFVVLQRRHSGTAAQQHRSKAVPPGFDSSNRNSAISNLLNVACFLFSVFLTPFQNLVNLVPVRYLCMKRL